MPSAQRTGYSRTQVVLGDLISLRSQATQLTLGLKQNLVAQQAGNYLSQFRGRGIDFEEVRLYQPGDDIRHMDWRVTARTQIPHTKVFREERERPVLLCVDQTDSMHFATRGKFKAVIAAHAAALLAWSALEVGDRVGGVVFSNRSHVEKEPKRTRQQLMLFLSQLTFSQVQPKTTQSQRPKHTLEQSCLRLSRICKPGSLIFVISDFMGLNDAAIKHLSRVAQHSQIILLMIYDPIEYTPLPPGQYPVTDGHKTLTLDTARKKQSLVGDALLERVESIVNCAQRFNIQGFPICTEADIFRELRHKLAARPGLQAYLNFAKEIQRQNGNRSTR